MSSNQNYKISKEFFWQSLNLRQIIIFSFALYSNFLALIVYGIGDWVWMEIDISQLEITPKQYINL